MLVVLVYPWSGILQLDRETNHIHSEVLGLSHVLVRCWDLGFRKGMFPFFQGCKYGETLHLAI